jgi:hypothetical protein
VKYIIVLFAALLLSSCRYSSTYSELKDLKTSKTKLELIPNQDLNEENQIALRTYFSGIKNVVYAFVSDTRMQEYTHRKFYKYFNESLCEDLLVSESIYKKLINKCTVNGFYICSDEVRAYKKILTSVKVLFSKKELMSITENKNCKDKLLNLGVLSE